MTGKTSLNRVHELPVAEADVRLFISVADIGSFTGAAALHELTPSAISKAVSRLEAALGVRLLTRTTRALHLTDEGRTFHQRCARAYELLNEAAEEASAGAGEVAGTVRIGLPSLFGTYFVAPRLAGLLAMYPKLRVELVTTMRPSDLVDKGLDLIIVVGPLTDSSLVARPLGYGQFVTVAAPAYIARLGRPQAPEDLAHHTCLAWTRPDRREEPWHFVRDGTPITWQPRGAVQSDDMHCLAAMAGSGVGITHVPLFSVADALSRGVLEILLEDFNPSPKLASFVYPGVTAMPKRVRTLMEHLIGSDGPMPGTRVNR